ncbi:hypothetical protein PG997_014797 [Apiospora hydei]|uniref:Rhodopsin domain-containing protein n=1 Tax=Apiospora hydei TaxID=1337664 RepID=A0ABR1UUU8_9PEZI
MLVIRVPATFCYIAAGPNAPWALEQLVTKKAPTYMNLSLIPALEPPPGSGIVPNFADPVSIAPICLVMIAITLPLMVIFLALRVYVRQWVARAVGADDVVFYLISVIVTLATCLPRAGDGGWSILSPSRGDRCFEEDSRFAEVQGIVGALIDLYVWIVPMTMIAKVRLSRKQKTGVYGVFATGFLACIVSIINAALRFEMFQSRDTLWIEVPVYALSGLFVQGRPTRPDTAHGGVPSLVSADYDYHAHLDRPWMNRDVAEDTSQQ